MNSFLQCTTSQFRRYALALCMALWLFGSNASADIIIDVNGTTSNASITASVTNGDVFTSGFGGVVTLVLPPTVFDIDVGIEGSLGNVNPWIIRGPADGSYLNIVRFSSGDISSFVLIVVSGNVTDLEVLDGVTSFMTVANGTGPSTNVTLNYNITAIPEPSAALFGVASLVAMAARRRRQLASV